MLLAATLGASPAGAAGTPPVQGPGSADPGTARTASAVADVRIRTSAPPVISPGDTVIYSVQLLNLGPADARNVAVSQRLPAAGRLLSASHGGVDVGGTVTWPGLQRLPAGSARTYVVRFLAPDLAEANGPLDNTATVSTATADPDPVNNVVTTASSLAAAAEADLAITKSSASTAADPGDTIVYTISIRNNGPDAATGVRVTDELPVGVTFLDAPWGVYSGGVVTWVMEEAFPSGGTRNLTLRVIAPSCGQGPFVNTASITADSPVDPDPSNNTAVHKLGFEGPACPSPADVRIEKSGPATAEAGDTIVYSITVTNGGPDAAANVLVSDTLPVEGRFVSASGGGVLAGRTVTWPLTASLPVGGVRQYTVRFEVQPAVPGVCPDLVNVAAVTWGDLGTNNDLARAETQVAGAACERAADLEILKEGPSLVPSRPPADSFEYAIRVVNLGPDTARDVVVEDVLPAAGLLVSVSGGGSVSGGRIVWPVVPYLAPLDTLRYTVWYRWPLSAGVRDTIWNTAIVTSAPVPGDPNPRNDTSVVRTTTFPSLLYDLDILKEGPAAADAGDTIEYRIRVRNHGPDPAAPGQVRDTLPAKGRFIDASGGVTPTGGVLTWSIPGLAPDDSVVFHIRVLAPATACGETLLNVAVVSSPNENAANDRSEVTTDVAGSRCTSVELRKVALPSVFRVGAIDTFRITVVDTGLAPVGPLTVTDTLSAGLTFVSASGAGWTVSATGRIVTGTYGGRLAPGDSASFVVAVRVDAGAVPEVCNRAAVEANGDPSNGPEATAGTCVPVEDPRLVIEKAASRDEAEVGDVIDYRLRVFTLGGGLPDVEVTDRLPTGFRYVPESARVRGAAADDPDGGPGPVLGFRIGAMASGDTVTVEYRIRVGPGTPLGPGINRAKATSGDKESNEATETVVIRDGVFSEEGTIVGKVFVDYSMWAAGPGAGCDCAWRGDRAQSEGEVGIPGVRVYLQDGTSALTDSEGKFLFYGLSPRSWVVKIDRSTLPDTTFLLPLSNRHARDGASVLVDLKMGELHRADFAVAVPDTATAVAMLARHEAGRAALAALETGPVAGFGSQGAIRTTSLFTEYRPLLADPLASGLDGRVRGTGGLPLRIPGLFERTDSASGATAPPAMEPGTWRHLAIGLLEARVDFRSLTDAELGTGRARDRFEDRLRSVDFEDDDGRLTGGARAALFYRGQVGEGTGLTLRLDTEQDDRARLFRDIRPDEFYPVYGDASIREFDAASRSRVFGRLERGASFLSYGDFNTAWGGFGQAGARVLGEYGRTLTGAVQHFENERAAVTAFASRDRSTQVVDVIPGAGISGPYSLSRTEGLVNSEHVQLVTRDRNQPAVILRSETLQRFLDYTVEPFTGRIVFRRPVPGVDADLNPVEIRVTYEVETGGDRFWILGANGQVRPFERLELGGGFVRDDNPLARFDLASANATLALGAGTWLAGEFARTDSAGTSSGDAARLELRHSGDRLAARAFFLDVDPGFDNPSAAFGRGRREIGLLAAAPLGERNRLFTELLNTRDRLSDAERTGARAGIETALNDAVRAQVGFRFARGDGPAGIPSDSADTRALGARLTATLPGDRPGSLFAEFEQDVSEADRRRLEVGGDYRLIEGVRAYARHEFLSSLLGPWDPYPGRDRNATVFGLAAENRSGQAVFSEYRVTDAISGRDAQAAIGLRNSWLVGEGVRLSTSVERLAPVGSGGRSATALTGAAEFTGSPLWKGSARLEFRESAGDDNLFGSLGYARKLNRDFTLLGNSVFSTQLDGGRRAFERTRVGIAWRETDRNVWNGLARYEHRFDRDPEPGAPATSRTAHVLAAHLDVRPDPRLILRGQWAMKLASESSRGLTTWSDAHLAGLRGTLDITSRLDAGLLGRTLFADGASRYGAGAELGLRLADGLRLAAGYNLFGFRDPDFSADEYTDRGVYVQLGMTFDEGLFRRGVGGRPEVCPCDVACGTARAPACVLPPEPVPPCACGQACAGGQACPCCPKADLVVDVDGPTRVEAGETFEVRVVTRNQGTATAESPRLRVSLPAGVRLVAPVADSMVSGSTVGWRLPSLVPNAVDTARLFLKASGVPDVLVTVAQAATVTAEITIENNEGRETTRVDPVDVPPGTADLWVEVSGPYDKQRGDTITYWLHAGNKGAETARYPVLTVDLPGELRFDSAGTFEGGGPRYEVAETGGRVVWVRGRPLEPGRSDSIWVAVSADSAARSDTVRLRAVIESEATDPEPSDNEGRFTTALWAPPPPCDTSPCPTDIAVWLFGRQAPLRHGQEFMYLVGSRNVSGVTAEHVSLRLVLPAGVVVLDSAGAVRPPEGPPELPRSGPAVESAWGWEGPDFQEPDTLVWPDLGRLRPGSGVTKTVSLRAPTAGQSIELEAETHTETPELNLANNYTRARRPLVPVVPPRITNVTVTVDGPPRRPAGSLVRYEVSVENTGDAEAEIVVLSALPGPADAREIDPRRREGFVDLTWIAGNLAVRAPAFTRTVELECTSPTGEIWLEAHATTGSDESDLRDNRARAVTICEPPLADVEVRILPAGREGRAVTWLITAFNPGPIDAREVRLRVEWPRSAGISVRSASPGGMPSEAGYSWPAVDVLPSLGSWVETITLLMPPALIDSARFRIDAFVSTTTLPELNLANNRDSTMVAIQDVLIRDTVRETLVRVDTIPVPFLYSEWPWWWPWLPLILLALIPVAILIQPFVPWPPRPGPVKPPVIPPPPPKPPLWGTPVPMTPGGPVDPTAPLPAACGFLVLGGRRGTVWLAERHRFVTCAHLVQQLGVGGTLDLRFGDRTLKATVESLDTEADVAVLRVPEPITGVEPLTLADAPMACGRWEGFARLDDSTGMPLGGAAVSGEAVDRFRGPRVSLTGREFVDRMLEPDQGLSGAPVLVDGKVVAQIATHVPHPDSLDRSFSSLVYGSTLPRIRQLLGRTPASPCTPSLPRPVRLDTCAGERHHAYVLFMDADRGFAERLITRLEGTGVRVLPLQHEDPGATPTAEEQQARASCRFGLVLFSRAWAVRDASRLELAAGLLRQAAGGDPGRVRILNLDGSVVPERFEDFTKVDFCDAAPDHGPALWTLLASFMPELDDGSRDAWLPIERVCDDIIRGLHDARGVPNRLRYIARRWREAAVPGDHVPMLAADFLVEAGRPDWALEALATVPRTIRSRQIEVLALAKAGRTNELIETAESLVQESVADGRTGLLLGDAYAGLWEDGGRQRQAWLTKALGAYRDCHARTGDPFAGARAAALALVGEGVDRAREIARQVREQIEQRATDPDAWIAAARGTASLILGERDEAREWFGRAAGLEPDALEKIAKTRDTVRLVLERLRSQPETTAAAEGMDDVLGLPAVALFVGAREHGWEDWRPPADPAAEDTGRQRIREQLNEHDVGCGISGLACEADLLFAEEVLAHRGLVEIVLPFARDVYLDVWIRPELRPRVEQLLADRRVTVAVPHETVPAAEGIEAAVAAATGEAERRARERAAEWGVEPLILEPRAAAEPAPAEAGAAAGFRTVPIAEWRPEPATRNIKVKRVSGAPPAREPRTYRKRFLVVVGVDRYAEWPRLRNAVNDAEGVAAALVRDYGFDDVRFLRNEEATAERIREEITEKLAPEVRDEDLVVFFFAGHGHTERAEDGSDHGFLVPVEAGLGSTEGLLPMEEVVSWTRRFASDDVLYVFDSCFSGFAGLAERVTERGGKYDARIAITAGTTEQPVLDGGAPGGAADHSVFTGYLLRGLSTSALAEPGQPFTAMDLFVYLRRQVDEATDGAQTPSCGFLHGHGIGSIWLQAAGTGPADGPRPGEDAPS